jgi:ribosome-binding factor A
MATTRRQKRVGDMMQKELAELLMRDVRDPRLAGVSITEVHVSQDLSYAKIYFSLAGDEAVIAKALDALSGAAGFLRSYIAQQIDLRRVPEFSFVYDEAFERGQRVLDMLDQIEQDRQEHHNQVKET